MSRHQKAHVRMSATPGAEPVAAKHSPPPPPVECNEPSETEKLKPQTVLPSHEKTCTNIFYDKVLPLAFWFALHFLVIAYLFVADTEISRDIEGSGPFIKTICYCFMVLAGGFLFLRTSMMDPGRVQLPEEEQKGLEPVDPSARFCPVCSHWQV